MEEDKIKLLKYVKDEIKNKATTEKSSFIVKNLKLKLFTKFKNSITMKLKKNKEQLIKRVNKFNFFQQMQHNNNSCQLSVRKCNREILLKCMYSSPDKKQFAINFELDTGSGVNLISINDIDRMSITDIDRNVSVNIKDYNNERITLVGKIRLNLNIPNLGFITVPFFIVNSEYNILGRNFMKKSNCILKFNNNSYFIDFSKSIRKICIDKQVILSNDKLIIVPGMSQKVVKIKLENDIYDKAICCYSLPNSKPLLIPTISKVHKFNGKSYIRIMIFNVTSSPLHLSPGELTVGLEHLKYLYKVKTVPLNFENFEYKYFSKYKMRYPMTEVEKSFWENYYDCTNETSLDKIIKKILINAEEVGEDPEFIPEGEEFNHEELINEKYFDTENLGLGAPSIQKEFTREDLEELFKDKSPELKEFLIDTFLKYPILSKNPWDCGRATDEINIEIEESKRHFLNNTKIYPLKPEMKEQLLQFLHYLIFNKIIEKSPPESTFGSPVFLINRKSGQQSTRLLVDQRRSNLAIKGSSCALMSCITRSLKSISERANFCSQLDLRQAFYSLPYTKETYTSGLTNFICEYGAFRFIRAVTGNCRSPSTLIDYIISHIHEDDEKALSIITFLLCHFDDINIFNLEEDIKEHFAKVKLVISRLHRMGLKLNLEKCKFAINLKIEKIRILGYDMGKNFLSPPREKMMAFENIKTPTTVKQLQQFLGGLTYFRSMLGLTVIDNMNVLSSKISKNQLKWDSQAEEAFKNIKYTATHGVNVINTPYTESINIVFSDSSSNSLGGVLFSCPIDVLNISTETNDLIFEEITNKGISDHVLKFDLNLKQLGTANSLMNIFLLANDIFELKLESTKEKLLRQMLTNGQLLGPSYASKIPRNDENMSKIDIFNEFLSNVSKNIENLNDSDFFLQVFSAMTDRQIFIILDTPTGQKLNFIKVGLPTYKTPLFLGYNIKLNIYYLYGLTKCIEKMKCSNYKYASTLNYEKLIKNFFNMIKTKTEILHNFKIGGYYSRTLTPGERVSPIYVSEGRAIFESLEFFAEQLTGKPTIILTDSEIAQALFSVKNVDKNRRLHKLALKLIHSFEDVRVLSVPGRQQMADFLTRVDIGHPLADKMYSRNQNLEFNKKIHLNDGLMLYTNWQSFAKITMKENEENGLEVKLLKQMDKNDIFANYLSLSKIYEAQSSDPLCKEIIEKGNNGYVIDKFDMLRNKINNKILIPKSLIFIAIAYAHSQLNHPGRDAMISELKSRFDFMNINLKEAINKYLNICLGCLVGKSQSNRNIIGSALNEKLVSRGDLITIDLLEAGTNQTTNMPSAYLFVLDVLTKHLSVYYLIKKREKDIIFAMLSYISSYGGIKKLLSDNASIFRSNKFKSFAQKFGIELVQTAPGYSEGRGHIERVIGLARQMIRCNNIESENTDVLTSLPLFILAKNNRIIANSDLSANDLQCMSLLGKNSPNFEINEITKVKTFGYRTSEYLEDLTNYRKEINLKLKSTIDNLLLQKEKDLKLLNKKRVLPKIKEGDFVLVKIFHDSTKREKQNLPKFSKTPFVVMQAGKHHIISKCLITGVVISRNIGHVKLIGKIPNFNEYRLPKELYEILGLLSPEDFDPKVYNALKNKPVIGKRLTRSKTKEIGNNLDNDNEVNFGDIEYF